MFWTMIWCNPYSVIQCSADIIVLKVWFVVLCSQKDESEEEAEQTVDQEEEKIDEEDSDLICVVSSQWCFNVHGLLSWTLFF